MDRARPRGTIESDVVMDETRTRQKLDDLADLFLTGVVDDPAGLPKGEPRPGPAADLIQGPAPIRLAPKAAGQAGPTLPPDDFDLEPDDSHPMLRLAREEDPPSHDDDAAAPVGIHAPGEADAAPGRAVVEAVVMGNLPGLSGPWLTQYAQLIAQSDGPVAVLHVAEDAIDLELVEPRSEALPAPRRPTATLRVPPMRGGRTGLLGLLDALVHAPAGPVQTILVRLEPTTDPRDLSRLAAINDWTLLCGSDSTAIAGCRHMLQQLTHADPRLAVKHVGVMIMGSDEDAASAAADQLARSAQDLLTDPVEFIGHLQRMQPVQVRQLGSFSDPVSLWPQLVGWFDDLELPEPTEHAEPAQASAPAPPPTSAAAASAAAEPITSDKPPRPTPTAGTADPLRSAPVAQPGPFHVPTPPPPAAITRRQSPAEAAASAARLPKPTAAPKPRPEPVAEQPSEPTPPKPTPKPTPKPRPAPSAASPAADPVPAPMPRNLRPVPRLDLAALLADTPAAIAGATPLDARIPHQRSAQLVVDDEGVIHILVRHESLSDKPQDADPRQAILDLIESRRWVSEHLELLALTQRDHDFVTTEPKLHLLTDRADLAMGLVARLGQSLKLHLLQEVSLGGETGWFCTPLN